MEHGYDVIDKMKYHVTRARNTKSRVIRANSLWLCDTALQWLLNQYGRFVISEKQESDKRWMAICNFLSTYSSKIGLRSVPVPLLGDSYLATGSFQYYQKLALRLDKEYYLASVDGSDPPVFWPLLLHELSHCWLGSRVVIDSICSSRPDSLVILDRDIVESRVEEALCDVLATKLIGPAYPLAYVNKLWAQFSREVSPWYPSHEFRIECMARILDNIGLSMTADQIRGIPAEKFTGTWEDEGVAWAISGLINAASEMPDIVSPDIVGEAKKSSLLLESKTPKNLPTLFLSCWLLLDDAPADQISSVLKRTSAAIVETLGGQTASFDSRA